MLNIDTDTGMFPKRQTFNRLQTSLTERFRRRTYNSPSSGPEGVQLSEEHKSTISRVLDDVRNGVSRLATQLTSQQSERESLLKPRVSTTSLTIARPDIKGAKIDESGDILLFSEDGMQVCEQKSDEEIVFKEMKPIQNFERTPYQDIEASQIQESDLASILSSYHFEFTFRNKKSWVCPTRWGLQDALSIADTGYSIEPIISGRRSSPKHSLELSLAPGVTETIFDAAGETLQELKLSVDSSTSAGHTIKINIVTNTGKHLVFAHIGPDGKLTSVYNQKSKPFKQVQLGETTSVLSLGNRIVTYNGEDYGQFPTTTALGEFRGVKEFHDAYYLMYQGVPSGEAALVVDKETLSVRTAAGNNGIISAEAFAFAPDGQSMIHISSEGGKKKTFTITRPPEGLTEGLSLISLEEKEAIAEDASSFLADEKSELERSKILDNLVQKLEEASADKSMKQFFDELNKYYREIKKVLRQVQFEEENREKQREKMAELEDKLFLDLETLPDRQSNVGILTTRIASYIRLREDFIHEINDLNLLPENERAELISRVKKNRDGELEKDREELITLLFGIDEKLEKHLLKGKSILAEAASAEPPYGHHRVTEKITEFEDWKKIMPVYQKIQQNLDLYFGPYDSIPSDISGEKKKQREDRNTRIEAAKDRFKAAFTKTRSDGITKNDIEQFTLAHIQAFADEILMDAREKNIDPEREQRFTSQMEYLAGQIETLADKDTETDIDRTARDIQKELTDLNQYRQDSRLFSEQLTRIEEQLEGAVQRAKEIAGEMKTERARIREKQLFTDIKAFGKEAAVAVQYEKREGATADQLSMEAMRRVSALFRGFDLTKQDRVTRIPESECSEGLLRIFNALQKFQTDYPEKTQKVDEFWDQLRYIRNQAVRDVEIEKGFHYKPGFYVMKFPEYFKTIEPSMGDLEIKLSGREYSGDIKLKTKPVWSASGVPSLQMNILGTAFSKELPYIANTADALDAARVFYWESPVEEGMNKELTQDGREAILPKIAREEMAAYFLIKKLLSEKGSKRLKKKMSRLKKIEKHPELQASQAQQQEVVNDLKKLLTGKGTGIADTYSMELNEDHIQDTIRLVMELWSENVPGELSAWLEEEDDQPRSFLRLKSQHPAVNRADYTISRKDLFERAQEFEEDFGEPLMEMHEYIQRNEERIKNRFMIGNLNKQNTLVETYRPTIHDFIRLKELNDRIEKIKLSNDRNVIVFCGAPGSGKTTLLLALTKYSKNTMMMVQGNNAKNARSLDPQNAETAAEKEILTQLSAGLLGFGDGDFVVIDEAPFMFNLFNTSHQVLDARRRLNITLDDIPNPDKSLDIDVFERGINTYKKGSINWIWIGNKVAELDPVIETRVETIDDDKLCSGHQAAWFISYLEKSSSDLGLHPDDVKLIAYKRLTDPVRTSPLDVNAEELKTEFFDSQELEEVIKTIDNRLMAARMIAQVQMEAWDTYEHRKALYKLGKPPCNLHSVGARDLQGIMPLVNYELEKPSDVGRMIYHIIKKNKNCSPEDLLVLARITRCHDEYGPEDFEKADQEARDRKIIGEAPNPTVASLNLITNRLDTLNKNVTEFATASSQNISAQSEFNTTIEKHFLSMQSLISHIHKQAPEDSKKMMTALQRMMNSVEVLESGTQEERTQQLEQFKEMVAYLGRLAEAAVVLPGGNIERPDFQTQKVAGGDMSFEDDDDELG